MQKQKDIQSNKHKIYQELSKYNLPYNEKYYNVNHLDDIIENAKLDDFFIKHTKYLDYIKFDSEDIAKEKALECYIENTDDDEIHCVAKNLINKIFTLSN